MTGGILWRTRDIARNLRKQDCLFKSLVMHEHQPEHPQGECWRVRIVLDDRAEIVADVLPSGHHGGYVLCKPNDDPNHRWEAHELAYQMLKPVQV